MKSFFFGKITIAVTAVTPLLPAATSVPLADRIWLAPIPKTVSYAGQPIPFPANPVVQGLDAQSPDDAATIETMDHVLQLCHAPSDRAAAPYPIRFQHVAAVSNPEGYEIDIAAGGLDVRASTAAGLFYGAQTVYQLLAYADQGATFLGFSEAAAEPDAAARRFIPCGTIRDEPAYRVRSVMLDLGRATFSPAYIERIIRIMGQLKLNTLHLHLYDDQLCGFRFKNLPLGRENPFSLDAQALTEIVRYARRYHISVMPELESWGHVASLVYHHPELSGGEGVYAGASFAVGEQTYALLEKMYDEIIPCLEPNAAVHVGLDEARWVVQKGEAGGGTPQDMVARIYEILMRVAERHHRTITMHLWADHGGRPLPPAIADRVVIEPWRYLGADAAAITEALDRYGGTGKTPLMMGGGANSTAFHGSFEATRLWCTGGTRYPNVLGMTLCLWETNDIAGRMITLYGGANYAWTPTRPARAKSDIAGERLDQLLERHMRSWQLVFPDASPAALDADRGPEVKTGRYVWPPFAGRPVAPTVDFVAPPPAR